MSTENYHATNGVTLSNSQIRTEADRIKGRLRENIAMYTLKVKKQVTTLRRQLNIETGKGKRVVIKNRISAISSRLKKTREIYFLHRLLKRRQIMQ